MTALDTIAAGPRAQDVFRFIATDVTGTTELEVGDLQSSLPVSAVARTVADRMSLPDNVPWALRDESTSVYLDDDVAIGDQIDADARVAITPRTHLG